MSIRTLVSVQTITRIEPIPGTDRIVLAHVLGWKVIISKDMHLAVGDKVAYFEPDKPVREDTAPADELPDVLPNLREQMGVDDEEHF